MSSVVDLVENAFLPAQVDLGIQFETQNGYGLNNLCGPASIAMINHWMIAQQGKGTPANAKEVMENIPNWQESQGTTYDQMVEVAKLYGITLVKRKLTAQEIQDELDAGRPLIVCIIRKYIPEWSQIYNKDGEGTHLEVVAGYGYTKGGARYFVTYDPLSFDGKLGDGLKVLEKNLVAGMNATGFASNALTIDLPVPTTKTLTDEQWQTLVRFREFLIGLGV